MRVVKPAPGPFHGSCSSMSSLPSDRISLRTPETLPSPSAATAGTEARKSATINADAILRDISSLLEWGFSEASRSCRKAGASDS